MKTYPKRKDSFGSAKRLGLTGMFSLFLCLFTINTFAQEYQVTGKVTDTKNIPIPGINIIVKGTTIGSVTDLDGNYVLNTGQQDAVIVFSAMGYIAQEFSVSGNQVVDITLEDELTALDEIVVIGYGTQKTSLVTGAISSVDAEDLENNSNARVEDAIQGKTAGISITPESGSPGAGMKVAIRGVGTNGDANPLYIVDGIRMGDINDISSSDIASVEILKDAASSAIYGAQGGNGVIIITTKSGSNKEGVVNYNFSYGIQSVGKLPELLNADQYYQYQLERGDTATVSAYDTDWMDEIFESAPMSTHNLSFSGGSEKSSYFSSLTYFNQDGIIGGDKSNFERVTARLNVDHKVKKWLKVGANVNFARSNRTNLTEDDEFGGLISSALLIDPYTPTHYDADNLTSHMTTLIEEDGEPVRMDADGRYFAISDNVQGEMINPILQMDLATGKTVSNNLISSLLFEVSPMEGLKFTSRPGINYTYSNYHDWTPIYYYSGEKSNSTLGMNDKIDTYYQWQLENFVTYTKAFGSHNISVVAGMSVQESKDKYLYTNTSEMVAEGDQYAEHDFTSDNTGTISGNEFPDRLVSYFGRGSYDYKDKYMLQATLRNDITSTVNVPLDNVSGIFPSFSAGWTLSEEEFFPKGAINRTKLRASWGQNGSISSITSLARTEGQYLYASTVTSQGLRYPTDNDEGYIIPGELGRLPNDELTWETSEQLNIGLDMKLLENRVTFTADYYIKNTKDLLMFAQYPSTSGTENPMINAGDVQNSGLEFTLGYRNNDQEFKYGVSANFSTLNNEVTKLNSTSSRLDGTDIGTGSWVGATAFEVGQPIWYFRGYETDGIDAATGDPIFVDQTGDGEITEADKTYLGDPHADFMFGASLFLEYKGFDLNVNLYGQTGNEVVYGWMRTDRLTSNVLLEFYEDRWTADNTDGSMPAAGADSRMYASDLMVKDGSYLRIKQIQLGYTIPSSALEVVKLSSARVFISLDNYFTFTKYGGMDPVAGSVNANSQGIDRGVYPTPRKVMFGLSVSF